MIDLNSIKKNSPKKPRIVIYGPSGIGKTTFGSCAPDPIFIITEDGLGDIEACAIPQDENGKPRPATSFKEVLECLESLGNEDHKFKTVVIDSIDWLEPLIWEATCKRCGKTCIEDIGGGYGKGYIETATEWKMFFDYLTYLRDTKDMYVIMIAHGAVTTVNDPTQPSYDIHCLKLNKRAAAKTVEFSDITGFAAMRTFIASEKEGFDKTRNRALTNGEHVLYLAPTAAITAKNRYHMPDCIPLDWEEFEKYLPGYIPPEAPKE
jgi:AAA domain